MGCCTSREPDQAPPLPPRETRSPDVDITHVRAPLSPIEYRPTLPPRLGTLNADQEAQIAGFAPPVPPKIPLLPPRPSETETQDPTHWQNVSAGIELAESTQNAPIPIPQIKLNRSNTSTLEFDPNPLPRPPRTPTPELENNVTPIYNSMVMPHPPQPPSATYHHHNYPDRYRSPVSELDPSELRSRTFSPVSAMDPMSRRQSLAVASSKAGPYLELEAAPAGPHIELPAPGQHGQVEIELPAVPMVPMQATVSGPLEIHMYHELDGGFGAAEMPVR